MWHGDDEMISVKWERMDRNGVGVCMKNGEYVMECNVGFEWNECKCFSDFLEATLIGNGWISFSDLDPRLDLNKCRIMDASVCNDGFSISEIVSAWHNGEMQACGHLNGGACEICKDRL